MRAPTAPVARSASLFLILLVALVTRLWTVTTARFTDEEALFYETALQVSQGEVIAPLGPKLSGRDARHPGAGFFYLMSLSQWISPTPEAANAFVAVLGAITVWLIAWAFAIEFGTGPALFAGLLLACSPWSILYADRIWNSNVVGLWVALAFWAAARLRREPGSPAIAVFFLGFLMIPQFHMSAPIVWIPLLLLIRRTWREWNRGWAAAGIALGLLAYAPYLVHELQTNFSNIRAFFGHIGNKPVGNVLFLTPIYAIRFLTLDTIYHEVSSYWGPMKEHVAAIDLFRGTWVRPFHPLRLLALLSSLALAWIAIRGWWRERRSGVPADYWRALKWGMIVTALLLFFSGKRIYGHYVQPLIPFVFIAFVLLWEHVARDPRRRLAVAALGVVFCVGGLEAVASISRKLDARNGLTTQRQVLSHILADRERLGLAPDDPVWLDFGFMGSRVGYEVLARTQYNTRLILDPERARVRYAVTDRGLPDRFAWELRATVGDSASRLP